MPPKTGSGDGYTADPDAMRSYSGTLSGYAAGIGEATGAVNEIMTDNSVSVGKDPARSMILDSVGLSDTGRLDLAYGIICQPAGMLLEDVQQKVADGIGDLANMMNMLSRKVGDAANQYVEREQQAQQALVELQRAIDQAREAPRFGGPGGMPPTGSLPEPPSFPAVPATPDIPSFPPRIGNRED